jgi:SAM-dependent methyltransferase
MSSSRGCSPREQQRDAIVWHDLECGSYRADLAAWLGLAARHGGPVLDVGAGTGRVALALARAGHRVTALDLDPTLLAELQRRAVELAGQGALDSGHVTTIAADARGFELSRTYPLIIAPMQTLQLLGGPDGRQAFLAQARRHLAAEGTLAVAVAIELEPFEADDGESAPLPDIVERDGHIYCSRPVAVRLDGDGYVLERLREKITPSGERLVESNSVRIDRVTVPALRKEARRAGLRITGVERIGATTEHVASEVVMFNVGSCSESAPCIPSS